MTASKLTQSKAFRQLMELERRREERIARHNPELPWLSNLAAGADGFEEFIESLPTEEVCKLIQKLASFVADEVVYDMVRKAAYEPLTGRSEQ